MIVSFALTEAEFLAGKKTVTRRRWKPAHADHFKAGTLHQAWSKVPYAKGARLLGTIRATRDAYLERLADMPIEDLAAEGGMCATVDDFIRLIEGTPDEKLFVARFEIVEFVNSDSRPGSLCICGKVIRGTEQLALAERDRIVAESSEHPNRRQRLHAYQCGKARNWHVGHDSAWVKRRRGRRAIVHPTPKTEDTRQE